ncbi:MAG: DNA-3-methyladenine glycosylase I [Bacilli bacterium]|nr:DNA-3-methyladenine glycosylase I [Bacilli bacterium]
MNRCHWVNLNNPLYIKYHDEEWGVPSYDDKYLFEMLVLESFQAGLSWECILNKRKAFYKAFDSFNYEIIAKYNDNKINELINNKEIVRNKRKILATINNAKIFMEIQKEYKSFSNYIWSFTNNKIIFNKTGKIIVSNELSDKISKDLKSRGMSFVGTTIIYSYLQAIGIINDHELTCDFRKKD